MNCTPPTQVSHRPPIAEPERLCVGEAGPVVPVQRLRQEHSLLRRHLPRLGQRRLAINHGAVANDKDVVEE